MKFKYFLESGVLARSVVCLRGKQGSPDRSWHPVDLSRKINSLFADLRRACFQLLAKERAPNARIDRGTSACVIPEAGNQYLAHILLPLTDNCSS